MNEQIDVSKQRWEVHKFGGTSLSNATKYRNAAEIFRSSSPSKTAVLVSAMAGVTDDLLSLLDDASAAKQATDSILATVKARQCETIQALLPDLLAKKLLTQLDDDIRDIRILLKGTLLLRSPSDDAKALVSSFGELWSARLLSTYLGSMNETAQFLPASQVLIVNQQDMGPVIDWDVSARRLAAHLKPDFMGYLIIPGCLAGTVNEQTTSLGRNGSDYSAAIFAALLDASQITIWTDVDGVMTANPSRVPDAYTIPALTYDEAAELAYFGASVIHPQTMGPAISHEIPIRIKNTNDPSANGTLIDKKGDPSLLIKGLTSFENVSLVNLEGSGMIGVPGTAQRLFEALNLASISVVMISQASSEHSLCCVVRKDDAERAMVRIRRAFKVEIDEGQIQSLTALDHCTIIAVVGDQMSGVSGVSGTFFSALGNAGINIHAIAQGSSERNISVVIKSEDVSKALRAAHAAFYLSAQTLSVGMIGCGTVGQTLLSQLGSQSASMINNGIDFRIRGIANSRKMLLAKRRVDNSQWQQSMESAYPLDLNNFVNHIQSDHIPHSVIIDCTASEEIARHYEDWLDRGIHIVTPNKKAHSGDYVSYQSLKNICRKKKVHFLYEATVGAGLPIINTLQDLRETGDSIKKISGIFSGTLSYLFNQYDGSQPFSAIVLDAQAKGFTEPDPRDDLSGMDVARKLVILAREAGSNLELTDLNIENLIPNALQELDAADALAQLDLLDHSMELRLNAATANRQVLRYIAYWDEQGVANVGLENFPLDHPFANVQATDNIVQFETTRYSDNPLIIQGPGAGPEVTAGGVFADLLRLASFIS